MYVRMYVSMNALSPTNLSNSMTSQLRVVLVGGDGFFSEMLREFVDLGARDVSFVLHWGRRVKWALYVMLEYASLLFLRL